MQLDIILSFFLLVNGLDFQFDQEGKVVFSEVVELDKPYQELLENASHIAALESTDDGTATYRKSKRVTLYKNRLGKSPDGKLAYTVCIEVREARYRYTLKDFRYYPMERNRYGRFEPVLKSERPLHVMLQKNGKDWEQHKENILLEVAHQVELLKEEMYSSSKLEEAVELTEEW